ncbi:MAG: sulfatase-like hydrolase/transferase, partial [Limisphaerales bacterium]
MKRVTLLLAASVLSAANLLSASHPNILWLTAEDMSQNLGCYGDPQAVTPRLDALARESVRYTRAFAPAPVCSPSR